MKWYWYLFALIITMTAVAYSDAAVIIGEDSSNLAGVSIDTPTAPTDFAIQNTNSSDFWDNLDVPTDIPGSQFWYNFSLTSTGIDTNFSEGGVAYGPILMNAENHLQFNSSEHYVFYNRTNETIQLVSNNSLQQSWGASTFVPGTASFGQDVIVLGEIQGAVGNITDGNLTIEDGNVDVLSGGNVSASVFKGTIDCTNITGGSDGDYCVDDSGGNSTFNQSLTDILYNFNYPHDQELNTSNSVTFENVTVNNTLDAQIFMSTSMLWTVTDDGSNVDFNFPDVGGNNYVGFSTSGGFMQLYANPNPSNDHLLFTVSETQGADTDLNFYEGGTGHNRLWDSGSMRVGGGASRFCSNLTSDVDCDTPLTGADLVVQDDGWFGGKLFSFDWSNVSITESQISDLDHVNLDNIAYENDTNEFTQNQNFSENITVLDRICFNSDCDRYIFANGSSIIIQG